MRISLCIIRGFLAGFLVFLFTPGLSVATEIPASAVSSITGTDLTHQISGTVDISEPSFLIIDDSQYYFSAESGLAGTSFTKGQFVEGTVNTKREIISLKVAEKPQQDLDPSENRHHVSDDSSGKKSSPVTKEKGLWKN